MTAPGTMRKLLLIAISGLVWLGSGCTASDREYVRNHIVLLEQQNSQNQPQSSLPSHMR
jgi:hypothetical protein